MLLHAKLENLNFLMIQRGVWLEPTFFLCRAVTYTSSDTSSNGASKALLKSTIEEERVVPSATKLPWFDTWPRATCFRQTLGSQMRASLAGSALDAE
jgi:hypothetical protein